MTSTVPVQPANYTDLWDRAYQSLRQKDRETLDEIKLESTKTGNDVQKLLALVEVKREESKDRQWAVPGPKGQRIILRDVFSKLAQWVKRFIEIGDTLVQYDPTHAAIPWACVRFVLQSSLNNIEKHTAILEGIENVSRLLLWIKIQQRLYLTGKDYEGKGQLESAFQKMQEAVLKLLARVIRQLAKPNNKLQSVVQSPFVAGEKFRQDVQDMESARGEVEQLTSQMTREDQLTALEDVKKLQAILEDIKTPFPRLENKIDMAVQVLDNSQREKILSWISSVPYGKHYSEARSRILKGTGKWLLQHPACFTWRDSSSSQLLWLHGMPGSGKSTLLTIILRDLIDNHDTSAGPLPVYFYCSRITNDSTRSEPASILRCILSQLSSLPGDASIPNLVGQRYQNARVHGELSTEETIDLIIEIMDQRPMSYLLIDALDECIAKRRKHLLDALDRILQECKSLVKVFVSSRDDTDIKDAMEPHAHIKINAKDNQDDIDAYVEAEIQRSKFQFKVDEKFRELMTKRLCEGAQGMFRWVALQLQFLQTLPFRKQAEERLGKLPKELRNIYQEIYEYHMDQQQPEVRLMTEDIFFWLLTSYRSLDVHDLRGLLAATHPYAEEIDEDRVLSLCFNLVMVSQEPVIALKLTLAIKFVHVSVRDFLEGLSEFSYASRSLKAARMCLRAIDCAPQDDFYRSACEKVDYVLNFWPYHVSAAIQEDHLDVLKPLIEGILAPNSEAFKFWIEKTVGYLSPNYQTRTGYIIGTGTLCLSRPLLLASAFNWMPLLEKLLENETPTSLLQLTNENKANALHIATATSSLENMRLLLDAGMDINAMCQPWDDEPPVSALFIATEHCRVDAMQLLIERGASVNHPPGMSPLFAKFRFDASPFEKVHARKLLLDWGADTTVTYRGFNCLTWACYHGEVAVAEMLIDRDIERGCQLARLETDRSRLGLFFASVAGGNEYLVELFLDCGADINETQLLPGRGDDREAWRFKFEDIWEFDEIQPWDALGIAAATGCTSVAQLLINRGASVDGHGVPPLVIAVIQGSIEMVKLLLENGADVNEGSRPPQDREPSRADVRVLGFDDRAGTRQPVSQTEYAGRTAVWHALMQGQGVVLRMLLENPSVSIHREYRGVSRASWFIEGAQEIKWMLEKHGAKVTLQQQESDEDPLSILDGAPRELRNPFDDYWGWAE